jgi:hypothetical protein
LLKIISPFAISLFAFYYSLQISTPAFRQAGIPQVMSQNIFPDLRHQITDLKTRKFTNSPVDQLVSKQKSRTSLPGFTGI